MNETQRRFVEWLSHDKKLSLTEARRRYLVSMHTLPDGHKGSAYRTYCDQSYSIYLPFHSDEPGENAEAYKFHEKLHFLRMLSYTEPTPEEVNRLCSLVQAQNNQLTILDYGCGLANLSRAMAQRFAKSKIRPKLVLCDIPTIRFSFLKWLSVAERGVYPMRFLACSENRPPLLPRSTVIVATEFLEHVRGVDVFLRAFHRSLEPGGLLVTNLSDHVAEFMHVTPALSPYNDRLLAWGYEVIEPFQVYRKPVPRRTNTKK